MAADKKVQCGDWHLGWGYGGLDRIGTLWLEEDGTFTYKGKRQGRHNNIIRRAYITKFELLPEGSEDKIKYLTEEHDLPTWSEVKKAIDILLTPIPPKKISKPRKAKTVKADTPKLF